MLCSNQLSYIATNLQTYLLYVIKSQLKTLNDAGILFFKARKAANFGYFRRNCQALAGLNDSEGADVGLRANSDVNL